MAMLLFVWYEDTFSNSGKKDRFIYLDIIKDYLAPYIDEVMPITYEFQQGNDPKHAAKVMRWPCSLPIWTQLKIFGIMLIAKIRNKN